VTRLWKHFRALWPGWSLALPLPYVGLAVLALVQHRFRWDHAAVLVVALALFSIGPRTKKLFVGAYPLGLVGALFDAMRMVKNVGLTPANVHLCDLRAHELALFGTTMAGERVTWHDWFLVHHAPALDLVCAIPYGTFIFLILGTAAILYVRDYPRMLRFTWCWLALNVAGFVTYHLYPAAPPWYFHAHGCTVDLAAHANEGAALARVDAMLGVRYFAGMYGRSSDVFGAMPSLHCAYALLIVLVGWGAFGRTMRAVSAASLAVMCFAAVYLDHHWILDVVAGLAYCAVVVAGARLAHRWWSARSGNLALERRAAAGSS
jgi:inositol phosphorylceramide synthase catalytic subunit